MLKLYYILNKILNIKFPPCKYQIPLVGNSPPVENPWLMLNTTLKARLRTTVSVY